jgi:hypothetical protein
MNNTLLIYAIVVCFIGTISLHFLSIKSCWRKQRKDKLIVTDDDYNNLSLLSKCKFTNKFFIGDCLILFLISFFLSAIITIFYVWQVYEINDFNIDNIAKGSFWFIAIYIIIIGIDEEKNNIEKLESKSLKNIIKFIMIIKSFMVKRLVSNETKRYKEFIKLKIKKCVNENKNFVAVLIICIHEGTFTKRVIKVEFKDALNDLNAELVKGWNNEKFTLEDDLVNFFIKDLIQYEFSYLEILEFINNVEDRVKLYNNNQIKKKLNRLKPYNDCNNSNGDQIEVDSNSLNKMMAVLNDIGFNNQGM